MSTTDRPGPDRPGTRLLPGARRLRPLGAAVLLLAGLSGCTAGAAEQAAPVPTGVDLSRVDPDVPGNGLWYLDGPAALEQVATAVRDARTATWTGRYEEAGEEPDADDGTVPPQPRSVEAAVQGSPGEYRATFTTDGGTVTIVVVDGRAYLSGDDAYATAVGLPEAAEGPVCVPVTDPLVTAWQPLLSARALLEALVPPDRVEVGVVAPVEGAPTVDLVLGAGSAPVGALTVSAVDRPLPVRLLASDASGTGDFSFSGWGDPVDVAVPDDVVAPCSG